MKNLILIIIICILVLLSIYFFIYKMNNNNLNNNEKFLDLNNYSYIGTPITSPGSSSAVSFYNGFEKKKYSIRLNNILANNPPIPDNFFLYNNKMLIILNTNKNNDYIYYINNPNLNIDGQIIVNKINFFIPQFRIKSIALDSTINNNIFVLLKKINNSTELYILKNFDVNINNNKELISIPSNENYFIDFDAKYGKLVGIGNKTNFIYQTDINKTNLDNNFKNAIWNILDKNQQLVNIKITLYGYVGQDINNKVYLCNQFNNYKWTLMNNLPPNSTVSNIKGTSSQGISLSINLNNNIFLYIYDEKENQLKLVENNEIYNAVIIDYIYPVIPTVPSLVPLDTASTIVNTDNIQNNSNLKYQQMLTLLNEIKENINQYYQRQLDFNNKDLNDKIQKRTENITKFKIDIGEPFENINQINFNKINNKLKEPPTVIIDGVKVKKKQTGDDLIINYP